MAFVGGFVLPMDRVDVEIDIGVDVDNEGISNESSIINGVVLFDAEDDKALFMFMFVLMFVFIALLFKELLPSRL